MRQTLSMEEWYKLQPVDVVVDTCGEVREGLYDQVDEHETSCHVGYCCYEENGRPGVLQGVLRPEVTC